MSSRIDITKNEDCNKYLLQLQLFCVISMLFCVEGFMFDAHSGVRSSSARKATKIESKQKLPKRRASSICLGLSSFPTEEPVALLDGYIPEDQRDEIKQILLKAGYKHVFLDTELENVGQGSASSTNIFQYKYIKASGMLKLTEGPKEDINGEAPKFIPIQSGMENVLVANGWSFLDPDESEPISAFDLDAANKEGQYKPKWGKVNDSSDGSPLNLSSLGYSLQREPYESIVQAAESADVTSQAKHVLLEGGTDKPHVRMTNNGYDFSTTALQSRSRDLEGIFVCAIGSLPLFSTADLPPSILSASDGWFSFTQPIADDHVKLIYPNKLDLDQRVEVVDARSGCHLGHFFGKSNGFCINASALNYIPLEKRHGDSEECADPIGPFSWRSFLQDSINNDDSLPLTFTPSYEILKKVVQSRIEKEDIILGAGCFWHVEFALRRLPGVINTETGYAGGGTPNPVYRDICAGKSGHAEVVKVTFDLEVCDPRKLIDCWLAMHDPTMVRAHGKRAKNTGQYRSCVFVFSDHMHDIAKNALAICSEELGKELSSEVKMLTIDNFWPAEERHQRHDERRRGVDVGTQSFDECLIEYGRRSQSVLGSSETIQVDGSDNDLDDGMARMMI